MGCPSMIDPCNGCPTEEICREAIKDVNGIFCPGKEYTVLVEGEDYRENGNRRGGFLSASHNCPVYCKEWQGEIQCPVYEDVCIAIGRDSQGALCDMDWWPPLCSGAQTLQDNGVDAIGCPVAPTCV